MKERRVQAIYQAGRARADFESENFLERKSVVITFLYLGALHSTQEHLILFVLKTVNPVVFIT